MKYKVEDKIKIISREKYSKLPANITVGNRDFARNFGITNLNLILGKTLQVERKGMFLGIEGPCDNTYSCVWPKWLLEEGSQLEFDF